MTVKSTLVAAASWAMEKVHGPGVYLRSGESSPHLGVPRSFPVNWWQKDMHYGSGDYERFGPVFSCVTILSQDVSRLPVRHLRYKDTGGLEFVENKAPMRVLRKPNQYQTRSDFFLYLMRSLLLDGNAYAIARRNERYEVESLYPINPASCHPYIEESTGDILYNVGGDTTAKLADIDSGEWFPARDVLHVRLQTPRHPLMGESPLVAATTSIVAGSQINAHNAAFFSNMSRPSGVLRHPGRIKPETMKRLKERWVEVTSGPNTGEPAVLPEGMDWKQLTMDAVSSELIKSYNLSERQVAQIFRIPSFLLSDLEKATISNVEGLMRFYVNSALGWYVDHLEDSLTDFFRLPTNERILFDLESVLLRSDLKERLDALGKGVQNGVYSPNEARAKENLPPVEDGDEVRVQQQLVPLSYGMELQPPDSSASADEPAEPAEPEEPTDEEVEESAEKWYEKMMGEAA